MIRKKQVILMAGGIVLGGILALVILLLAGSPASATPKVGDAVPKILLNDLKGNKISLADYRGKVVIVNFWFTNCKPCEREIPLLASYSSDYADDLVVLGINSIDTQENINRFVDAYHINFPVLLDSSGEVTQIYYVRGYPSTYLIDANGILRAIHIGEISQESMDSYLRELGVVQ